MPGPLPVNPPVPYGEGDGLIALVDYLRRSLSPDAVTVDFVFIPLGTAHGWRASGRPGQAGKPWPARTHRKSDDPNDLVVHFAASCIRGGTLRLVRAARRPWTPAERARLDTITPLVIQTLGLVFERILLAASRDILASATDALGHPILVLDRSGTIVFANDEGDDMLSRQTEESLAVSLEEGPPAPLMTHLIRLAASETAEAPGGGGSGGSFTSTSAPRTPLASPGGSNVAGSETLRLALTDGRLLQVRMAPSREGLRVFCIRAQAPVTVDDVRPRLQTLGVSDREAEVVSGVLQGLRNAEIAKRLFISEYTVKDHLKHVFAKMGVGSRASLIRVLYEPAGDGEATPSRPKPAAPAARPAKPARPTG